MPIAVHFGAVASGKASVTMKLAKSSVKVESLPRVRRHGAWKFNTPMMISSKSTPTGCSVLLTLNLVAFAFHTAARLAVLAWREAVIARGATYRFFEHLRTVTAYVVFETWDHLLRSIAAAAVRPP